jgi:hypothetical protein
VEHLQEIDHDHEGGENEDRKQKKTAEDLQHVALRDSRPHRFHFIIYFDYNTTMMMSARRPRGRRALLRAAT